MDNEYRGRHRREDEIAVSFEIEVDMLHVNRHAPGGLESIKDFLKGLLDNNPGDVKEWPDGEKLRFLAGHFMLRQAGYQLQADKMFKWEPGATAVQDDLLRIADALEELETSYGDALDELDEMVRDRRNSQDSLLPTSDGKGVDRLDAIDALEELMGLVEEGKTYWRALDGAIGTLEGW